MFGKRSEGGPAKPHVPGAAQPSFPAAPAAAAAAPGQIPNLRVGSGAPAAPARPAAPAAPVASKAPHHRRSENYYDIKGTIFNALIDAIDLTQLSQLDRESARDEIRDIVNEIITLKDVAMSIAEQEELL
jgi:pilus assembly protein CpaF